MKHRIRLPHQLFLLVLLPWLDLGLSASAQNPIVTYQGRIQTGGNDFTGTGLFKFALVTSSNANTRATATATTSGGYVTIYTVTYGGSGYLTAPTVYISGGGGSGATAVASISGGMVTQVNSLTPGSGYTSIPTVTISPPPENLSYTTYWSNDGTSGAGSEPATAVSTAVNNGLFTVRLGDTALNNMAALGAGIFVQPELKLRIWFNDGVHGFSVLDPAQPLTAAPYAVVAGSASNVLGTVGSANLGGTYTGAVTLSNTANSFTGKGTGLTGLDASQLSAGTVPEARMPASMARTNQVWLLGGNAGTTSASQFLGTTDNQPLEFKVNGIRALRLEFGGNSSSYGTNVNGAPNVVGGSPVNFIGAGILGATIAGGGITNWFGVANPNSILSDFGTIGGGFNNTVFSNSSWFATIAGGGYNQAVNSATVGGGHGNRALGEGSTVGGGGSQSPNGGVSGNTAYGSFATIGGGGYNYAIGSGAVIGGGFGNVVGTNSSECTIGGGYDNEIAANADYATIPGGFLNFATNYGFAAGFRAKANHPGAFVWGDSNNADVLSTSANSVTMRAAGGYRLFSNSGASAGVSLASGGTAWAVISDRNVKKDFSPVDSRVLLEKLASIPITRWHYQWETADVTLHIGPMAQDFKAAFYPGADDKSITTQEADGVALVAIQGLNQKLQDELQRRDAENAELKARLERLEKLLHVQSGGKP